LYDTWSFCVLNYTCLHKTIIYFYPKVFHYTIYKITKLLLEFAKKIIRDQPATNLKPRAISKWYKNSKIKNRFLIRHKWRNFPYKIITNIYWIKKLCRCYSLERSLLILFLNKIANKRTIGNNSITNYIKYILKVHWLPII
jgi:hypothetical protein